ncbi:MAG: hypothetical protein WA194_06835 [Patescibacteria group bacterium]
MDISKYSETVKKSVLAAAVFCATVTAVSVSYAALTAGLTAADLKSAGNQVSVASWNRIVNSVLELDARTSQVNYVEGAIGTSAALTLPYSTSVYTQNSITLPAGRWEVTMAASVIGNNYGYNNAWNAYHVHHNLSSTQPSYTAYQSHSYWAEGAPYANSPVIQIVDVPSATTLYWFTWFN